MLIHKSIQQINSTLNLENSGNASMLFTVEKIKGIILDFLQDKVKVLQMCFLNLIKYQHKTTQYNIANVKLPISQPKKIKISNKKKQKKPSKTKIT